MMLYEENRFKVSHKSKLFFKFCLLIIGWEKNITFCENLNLLRNISSMLKYSET